MNTTRPRKEVKKIKHFPCEKCNKNFSTKFSMQRHSRECGVTPTRVACEKCNKSLKNMEILEKHRMICFGLAKKVICRFCDDLFSGQFSLRRHLWRFHQNEDLSQLQKTVKQDPILNEKNSNGNLLNIKGEPTTPEKKILNYSLPRTDTDDKNNFCYYYMDICYDYEYLEDEDSTDLELNKPVIYPPEDIQE